MARAADRCPFLVVDKQHPAGNVFSVPPAASQPELRNLTKLRNLVAGLPASRCLTPPVKNYVAVKHYSHIRG
jgi:hypothetical protein